MSHGITKNGLLDMEKLIDEIDNPVTDTTEVVIETESDSLMPAGAQIFLIVMVSLFSIATVILVILLRCRKAKNPPEG